MKKVLIRLDSSYEIGSGHAYRCLVLAEEIQSRGIDCEFICKDLPGHMNALITSRGYRCHEINKDLSMKDDAQASLQRAANPKDLFIVDNYFLDQSYEGEILKRNPLMVIDDMLNRKHSALFYLDQNYRKNYADHPAHHASQIRKVYLGPEFALIRNSLKKYRNTLKILSHSNVFKILVFFGGSDPTGETQRFILETSSLELKNTHCQVIVSKGNPFLGEILRLSPPSWMSILPQPLDFEERLAEADFYFGSGGSITWERMFVGLPGATISIAENQIQLSQDIANAGYGSYLGRHTEINYTQAFAGICQSLNSKDLALLSEKCRTLVDGSGAERIVNSLLEELS